MRVFLSYRRDYARWVARAMCQALERRGVEVFLDVEAIDSGQLENVILNQIGQCEHFVVLLTTGTARDLGRAGDWVTKELERGLELERNVIPILVDDASIEDVSEAFSRRGELLALNFLRLPHDLFDQAVAVLVERFLTQPSLQELRIRTAREHYEAGTRALRQTNWAVAEAEFEEALMLRTRPEYFFGRGRAKQWSGRNQEALNDYEAAISLDPFAYELMSAKFDVLQQLDRLDEAVKLHRYSTGGRTRRGAHTSSGVGSSKS